MVRPRSTRAEATPRALALATFGAAALAVVGVARAEPPPGAPPLIPVVSAPPEPRPVAPEGPAPATVAAPASPPVRASDPREINGLDLREPTDSDWARRAGKNALLVPREAVDSLFFLAGSTTNLIHDQQVVPRVAELINPRPGTVVVYPTLFAETGSVPSVGARMVAAGQNKATSLRTGFGGVNEVVGEARLNLSRSYPLPTLFSLEALADRRTDLQFYGLGQVPESDPRNHFQPGTAGIGSLYREQRVRGIASAGIRPSNNVELFLSASVTRAFLDDAPGAGARGIAEVFQRGSLPGVFADTTLLYTEAAFRIDTRVTRSLPSPGLLFESYAGAARGAGAMAGPFDPSRQPAAPAGFVRAGGRAAVFLPIYRPTNIFSAKLVLDGLVPVDGLAVPLSEMPRQPEFRGNDTRRDYVSMVGSLDYRWQFARSLAARIFFDAATVGPRIDQLPLNHFRVAGGFGLDFSSPTTEIARIALGGSSDGVLVLLSFGVASRFGDRQHHD